MNLPGDFQSSVATEALQRIMDACDRNDVFAGIGGDKRPERQAEFIRSGGSFITTNSEISYLSAAIQTSVSFLRDNEPGDSYTRGTVRQNHLSRAGRLPSSQG